MSHISHSNADQQDGQHSSPVCHSLFNKLFSHRHMCTLKSHLISISENTYKVFFMLDMIAHGSLMGVLYTHKITLSARCLYKVMLDGM